MTLALTVFKKSTLQKKIPFKCIRGSKFDLDINWVKVNLGSLLEQTW